MTTQTARSIRFHSAGPSSVLAFDELPLLEPGDNEIRIKVQALGMNRAEIMFREGQYLETPVFPSRLGSEASGIVDAICPLMLEDSPPVTRPITLSIGPGARDTNVALSPVLILKSPKLWNRLAPTKLPRPSSMR